MVLPTTRTCGFLQADYGNHLIRGISVASGAVTTLAGNSSAGRANGLGTAATFNNPTGITMDAALTFLLITDFATHLIRRVSLPTGIVTTLAGGATSGRADGVGVAATFYSPEGIAVDASGTFALVVRVESVEDGESGWSDIGSWCSIATPSSTLFFLAGRSLEPPHPTNRRLFWSRDDARGRL